MLTPVAILAIVALALASALVVGAIGLLLLRIGRRWELTKQLWIVVLATCGSAIGGFVLTATAMYLSAHDLAVGIAVALVSAAVALGVATVLGRSFMRNSELIRLMARDVAAGTTTALPSHRSAELTALAAELAATSDRLTAARAEIERTEAGRRELVAWASHDLRTPLASIRAMVEALEDGLVPDPDRYHRAIHGQVERLAGMVDDLLELSRLDAGRLVPDRAPVSVYDLVSDAIADVTPVARDRSVTLRASGDLDSTVIGDAGLLARMLGNLLTNALRYAPAGSAVVIAVDALPDQVQLAVTDAGGGVERADLDRVFEAGWRGDPARASDAVSGAVGAGLGLAIVKGIAEAHGGSTGVRNVDGGARFEVRLARDPDPMPGAATTRPPASEGVRDVRDSSSQPLGTRATTAYRRRMSVGSSIVPQRRDATASESSSRDEDRS